MNTLDFILSNDGNVTAIAKELVTNGITLGGKLKQYAKEPSSSATVALLKKATEEELIQICTDFNWVVSDEDVVNDVALDVETVNISVTTTDGSTQQVECIVVENGVKNFATSKKKDGGEIITPKLRFMLNDISLIVYHDLFRKAGVMDAILSMGSIPIKKDTLTTVTGRGRNGMPYVYMTGALLESAIPALAESRNKELEKKMFIATMDKKAQNILIERKAENQLAEYERLFGKD